MTAQAGMDRALFTELAAVLANGYLRLAETRRNCAISGHGESQKELDVRPEESADGVQEAPQ